MFNYEYRSETTPGRVCLEISLKPFGYDKSPAGIEAVARHLFLHKMRGSRCRIFFGSARSCGGHS